MAVNFDASLILKPILLKKPKMNSLGHVVFEVLNDKVDVLLWNNKKRNEATTFFFKNSKTW